jgi:hypothetical protein
MKQLTKEQAIEIANSEEWKNWTNEEIVKLQLYQKKLCMPFSRWSDTSRKTNRG